MKFVKLFFTAGIIMLLGTSCGEKDAPENGKVYDPEESREIFEEVATRFVEKIKTDEIDKVADFANTVIELIDNSDVSAIEDWADDLAESMEKYVENYATKATVYEVSDFTGLYSLSKFKGHFELKNNVWVRTDADDLQFIMKDSAGKQYSLKLVTSGKTSTVELYDDNDVREYDGDWDQDGIISEWEKGGYINENGDYVKGRKSHEKVTVVVPENIDLVAKLDSEEYIRIKLHTECNDFGPIEKDYDVDCNVINAAIASITGEIKLLDYQFQINELKTGNGKPAVGLKLAKGNENLLVFNVKADGFKFDLDYPELNKVELSADLLGEIQIKGTANCKDIINLESHNEDEKLFKKDVDLVNDNIDIGVYFGNSTRQATVQFAAFYDKEFDGWYAKPVIVFEDGTSYAIDDYFSEIEFDELSEKIEKILEEIEDSFGVELDVE